MPYLLISIILILIAKRKKGTNTGKILNIIATIFWCIFIFSNVKGCMRLNNINVDLSPVDTSNIAVELNDYNKTSVPIGVGEYSFEKDKYSEGMYFCLDVSKNSNSPWCGAITAEIEFFDEQNNSIGKDAAKSGSLRMDMGDRLKFGFSTNDGKIIYNQKEVVKIVLSSIYEEDDIYRFLKSNFNNKKYELQKCIDEKNYDMFYSKLESVRNEYPREQFADENMILDDMENSISGAKSQAEPSSQNVEKSVSKGETTQSNEKSNNTAIAKENIPPQSYKNSCSYVSSNALLRNNISYKNEPVCVGGIVSNILPIQKDKLQSALEYTGLSNTSNIYGAVIADPEGVIAIVYDENTAGGQITVGSNIVVYGECIGSTELTTISTYSGGGKVKVPFVRLRYLEY